MQKILNILMVLLVLIGMVSCGIKNNDIQEIGTNGILNNKDTISTQKNNSEIINNIENPATDTYEKDTVDKVNSINFDYSTVVMDDEFFEKNPDIGEAILKITPIEYSFFTYITESGKRDNDKKCTELSVSIEEVVMQRGCSDLNVGQNITLFQYLYVYPSVEYWNDFAEIYGGDSKSIECIPTGLYKHDNTKLNELGINTISTIDDTPLLQCGESYYAYVSSVKNENGTDYYSCLYCDDNYIPVEAGANGEKNYSTLAGTFSGRVEEFAERVKELKK